MCSNCTFIASVDGGDSIDIYLALLARHVMFVYCITEVVNATVSQC